MALTKNCFSVNMESIRKICFFIILFCVTLSCKQQDTKNSIYGKIKSSEKAWIFLQKISEEGFTTIDSTQTSGDGSFRMKNPATSPDFYILRADPINIIYLVLRENESVEIIGDSKDFENNYSVKGSKDSELIKELRAFDRKLNDSLTAVYENSRAASPLNADSIGMGLQIAYSNAIENFAIDFIRNNMRSIVSLSATKFVNQYSELSLLNALKDSLSSTYPDNRYVKDFALLMSEVNNLPPGSDCPDISLKTPDGKLLSLSEFKGKVVLIDFWASWCAPCRRDNPNLVRIYQKFKGSDFEIFGVSLDENLDAWKNAIEKDNISWPQVGDLQRWNSEVVKKFYIESIPYNILLNREGKIIAKGLRMAELEMRIQEAINPNS